MFTRKRLLIALGLLVLASCAFILLRAWQAATAARDGRAHLQQAAAALRAQDIELARAEFASADARFNAARAAMRGMGPLRNAMHVVPLVRVQFRGVETMADVGVLLSQAGRDLTDASAGVLAGQDRSLSQSLAQLREVETALREAVDSLSQARQRTGALDGYRLLGPLSSTRAELEAELADAQPRAVKATGGVQLLLWLMGADGPRRTLIFSQNPDEVRPTGGYTGTFGVLAGRAGHVRLLRYSAMGPWVDEHPDAVIPPRNAPTAFRFATPPQPQQFANVNASPDWPSASRLAMRLWQKGGEEPVDGVFSLMPETLARVVGVLGPVQMPAYGETITAGNLVDRLEFYTHREAVRGDASGVRKQFIVDLARVVMQRLLAAPSSRWLDLGKALAASFDAAEALMYSADADIQGFLRALNWSGELPTAAGDFFADAEFEYLAKNGGALQRTFTHEVTLRADGGGTATTTMLLRNTVKAEPGYNDDSLSYITPYGPVGGVLAPASDRPDHSEPALLGHPTAGYLRAAQPLGSMQLRVGWRARVLARPRSDGSLVYTLEFRGQPGHRGDLLLLKVEPPAGWHWEGPRPPSRVVLYGTYRGAWVLSH
jgi:hypothetical protein